MVEALVVACTSKLERLTWTNPDHDDVCDNDDESDIAFLVFRLSELSGRLWEPAGGAHMSPERVELRKSDRRVRSSS